MDYELQERHDLTKATLTYGHGKLHDLDTMPLGAGDDEWEETDANGIAAWAIQDKDAFVATVTPTAAAQTANLAYELSTTLTGALYTKALVRFKTSASAAGVKAGLIITYTDASTEATDLGYSTTWKVTTATPNPAKTVDKVAFKVTSDTGVTSGTFYVYFDFFLVCKGVFTFPFVSDTEEAELDNNHVYDKIPSRVGNLTQYNGADSPLIRFTGDMDTSTNWGTPLGRYLVDVWKNSHKERWQWLTSDLLNCKVSCLRLVLRKVGGSKVQRLFAFEMRKFDQSSGDSTLWDDLSWMGIT